PGISNATFLKTALNEIRKYQDQSELSPKEFLERIKEKAKILGLDETLINRSVNVGFSGGEKKRNEIFQMLVLEPKFVLLDETDSGLDIDALRIVSNGVNIFRKPNNAVLVVTHYQRLLNYIQPDYVHVLSKGKIIKSGGKDLALELEEKGYDWIKDETETAPAKLETENA
ncbi:MAG: Fe-S cluster assembly ATPase SufC, partial [Bacteroidota bacterium]